MMSMSKKQIYNQAAEILNSGGIIVMLTDTIYGVLARADNEAAVAKVYAAKHRDESKSSIILVSSAKTVPHDQSLIESVSELDRPTSIIVPKSHEPTWITRGNKGVAYRLVHNPPELVELINKTGPLIAPSANPEGLPPAHSIEKAKEYFGDAVDLYIDGGEIAEAIAPSRIVELLPDGSAVIIRE